MTQTTILVGTPESAGGSPLPILVEEDVDDVLITLATTPSGGLARLTQIQVGELTSVWINPASVAAVSSAPLAWASGDLLSQVPGEPRDLTELRGDLEDHLRHLDERYWALVQKTGQVAGRVDGGEASRGEDQG